MRKRTRLRYTDQYCNANEKDEASVHPRDEREEILEEVIACKHTVGEGFRCQCQSRRLIKNNPMTSLFWFSVHSRSDIFIPIQRLQRAPVESQVTRNKIGARGYIIGKIVISTVRFLMCSTRTVLYSAIPLGETSWLPRLEVPIPHYLAAAIRDVKVISHTGLH